CVGLVKACCIICSKPAEKLGADLPPMSGSRTLKGTDHTRSISYAFRHASSSRSTDPSTMTIAAKRWIQEAERSRKPGIPRAAFQQRTGDRESSGDLAADHQGP